MTDVTPLAPRPSGKRGLKLIRQVPRLRLARFKAPGAVPPPSGDVTGGLTQFGMFGNDQYGDCGAAAVYHGLMLKALSSGNTAADYQSAVYETGFTVPTDQIVESMYFAYGRAQGEPGDQPDQGVDNATWLKFLKDQGVIELYAQLDPTDLNQVRQAMLDFKGVLTGIALTDDAEQEFENHQPWTVSQTEQPDHNEGHDIWLSKYGPEGDYYITWAELQLATPDWFSAEAEAYMDCWVIFSKEDGQRAGVDVNALEAEINSWSADDNPQPVEKKGLLQKAEEWVEKEAGKVEEALEKVL